jgi:hypothetical protein
MTTKDIPCQYNVTPPCADSSYASCPHCSLDLCLEHINEHQQLVRIQFNEVIDQINYEKSVSNNHLVVDEMKAKALAELDKLKTEKIEAVMSIYTAAHIRVEDAYAECVIGKSKVQSALFEELNMASNAIDKKKNIHPRDIELLKQKINELNATVKGIEWKTDTDLTTIVANTKQPETVELEQRLQEAQERSEKILVEHQKKIEVMVDTIYTKGRTLGRLQLNNIQKDRTIENLRLRLQSLNQLKGRREVL